jgi:hypothetical protein
MAEPGQEEQLAVQLVSLGWLGQWVMAASRVA